MNPVSLYITTSRLVFQSGCGGGTGAGTGPGGTDSGGTNGNGANSSAFADLNRLLPYLRKSLSCAVCFRLLLEPHTPAELNCQHHVCRGCVGERKKLKPSCSACKDYNRYVENTQLRMLLQCYKSICEYIKTKPFFAEIRKQATGSISLNGLSVTILGSGGTGSSCGAGASAQSITVPSNLFELIEEGAQFQDNYRCSSGLTKSAYSILPCIYPAPPVTVSAPSAQPVSQSQSQQMVMTSSGTGVQMQAKVLQTVAPIGTSTGSITFADKQQHLQQQQQQQIHQHANPNRQQHHHHHQQQQQQQQQQHHLQQQQQKEIKFRSAPIKTVSNGSTMYSVLYAGNGNKITIKRKTDPPHIQRKATIHTLDKEGQIKLAKTLADNSAAMSGFKMPQTSTGLVNSGGGQVGQGNVTVLNAGAVSKQTAKQLLKRRGCRCGNATATPGKLTCCGQRCPCYVDSKSCVDCKCRGCRNPHRADGMKVRPHIPELQNLDINLHNSNEEEPLTTATTTVLGSQTVSSVSGGGNHFPSSMASTSSQAQNSGLTAVSTGGKGLTQISHLPGGSTLKITPTSIANVLNSTNQICSSEGMDIVPSGGLLDSNGFSYITQASLDAGTPVGTGPTTQYSVPGSSIANGGTIHVVGIYATHLGDVSCSPTLSNMIRTDSGLNSLLTHKPPDALLTQTSLNSLNMATPSSLMGHALFNPTTTTSMPTSGISNIMSSSVTGVHGSVSSGMELTGIGVGDGTGIDISDQLDLTGTNLITIDGGLDDRLHADDV